MERIEKMKKFKLWLIDGMWNSKGEMNNRYCGIIAAKNLEAAKEIIAAVDLEEGSGLTLADYIFTEDGKTKEPAGYYPVA